MFKPAGWPETCYVQEAVYWVAMGRVPEFLFSNDFNDNGDARMGEEALQMADVIGIGCQRFFHAIEFAWAGVKNIDYDRYLDAPSGPAAFTDIDSKRPMSGAEYLQLWEGLAASSGADEDAAFNREYLLRIRRQVEDHNWRMELEMVFEPMIQAARVRVLRALMDGELPAFGLVAIEDTPSEYDEFKVADIPANKWRMDFNWDESRLSVDRMLFNAVQVKTDDVLKVFKKPFCEPLLSTRVDIYPGVAILSDDEVEEALSEVGPRRRGRPKKGGGMTELYVRNWAKEKVKRGEVPDKRDAFETEAIEFVKTILEQKVSRTTVQTWLKGILLPKNTPKNAGKSVENRAGK